MTEKRGPGSIAFNFHEGSRSEYLAQFVFSSFGTAIPVPHQEDTGLDIYCTLLERDGRRAWPRAYYSVQVKSTTDPWVFEGTDSVRWFIEHPMPIFPCIVLKAEARVLVYHTTPRFATWTMPSLPERLVLEFGTKTQAQTATWDWIGPCKLEAPVLNFTIKPILDDDFRAQVKNVLKFWIDFDVDNLVRIKNGIQQFVVPADCETNKTKDTARTMQGVWRFRDETFQLAKDRLRELMWHITTHCYNNGMDGDIVSAMIYAMALRHLSPEGYVPGQFTPHNMFLHNRLNELFGFESGKPGHYQYIACDSLLQMVKDELTRHTARSNRTFRLGQRVRSATDRC
jgi:hypothetical protein